MRSGSCSRWGNVAAPAATAARVAYALPVTPTLPSGNDAAVARRSLRAETPGELGSPPGVPRPQRWGPLPLAVAPIGGSSGKSAGQRHFAYRRPRGHRYGQDSDVDCSPRAGAEDGGWLLRRIDGHLPRQGDAVRSRRRPVGAPEGHSRAAWTQGGASAPGVPLIRPRACYRSRTSRPPPDRLKSRRNEAFNLGVGLAIPTRSWSRGGTAGRESFRATRFCALSACRAFSACCSILASTD